MPTPLDLQAARNRLAASLDATTAQFYDQLVQVWRRLDRQLGPLVRQAASESPSAIIRAARAGRLKAEIGTALDEAGWGVLISHATGTGLNAVLTSAKAVRLAADVAGFTPSDMGRLDALKALSGSDVLAEGEAVSQALWRATVQGIYSSRSTDQILADLGDLLDHTAPQIRTLYDTSISVFAREVEALGVAQDPERPFVYTGPNDAKVRPFCRVHLGKVYTKTAIDKMDNGQLPNVFLTCGGYNCRHGWTAVSKFSSLAPLANTGKRVPELSHGIEEGGSKAA